MGLQVFDSEIFIKVACTSGPVSSKIIDGYPLFSMQINHFYFKGSKIAFSYFSDMVLC